MLCSLPNTIKSEELFRQYQCHLGNLWIWTLSLPFRYKANVDPKQTCILVATEAFFTIITTEIVPYSQVIVKLLHTVEVNVQSIHVL